ncbi:hypothetical protein WG70_19860 [Burkholderia oklahomensis EO147]|nr:hypothetical protein WG70_19860 [Burkholderia oklahomensis EO147]KUY49657.1 hypothetical protein WG70_18530 [Burkholderia oklahomensis EO147]
MAQSRVVQRWRVFDGRMSDRRAPQSRLSPQSVAWQRSGAANRTVPASRPHGFGEARRDRTKKNGS